MRYLRFYAEKEFPIGALKTLLQAAVDLPEGRDAKLAMVRSAAKPLQTKR